MPEPFKVHLSRVGVGAVAGFVVALVKYVGDDVEYASKLIEMDWPHIAGLLVGYSAVPVILGAIGGWISGENSVPKIFWVALTAPVILAAAAGEGHKHEPHYIPAPGKAGWNLEMLLPITPAYADEAQAAEKEIIPNSSSSGSRGENPFVSGFKLFFGRDGDQTRYRVVVASINDFNKASATAEKLNSMNVLPQRATVGERKPGNDYYPVVVNGWLTSYQAAKALRERVSGLDLGLPDQPYISLEDR